MERRGTDRRVTFRSIKTKSGERAGNPRILFTVAGSRRRLIAEAVSWQNCAGSIRDARRVPIPTCNRTAKSITVGLSLVNKARTKAEQKYTRMYIDIYNF